MRRNLIVVIILAVLLISGCVLTDFFVKKPEETQQEFDERQAAAQAKAAAAMNVLLGMLGVIWPAGAGALGVGVLMWRKYKPILGMLKSIIGAIEDGAPGKAADEPVKSAVMALRDPALDRLVYNETHPAI